MTKIHRRWVTVAAVTVMAAALVGGTAVVALDQGRAEGWSEIAAQLPASVGPVLPDTDRPAAVTPVVEPDAAEEVATMTAAPGRAVTSSEISSSLVPSGSPQSTSASP